MFGSKKKLKEEITELKDQVTVLYRLQFRVGDIVYVNDNVRNPRHKYYLLEAYNNGYCYYISQSKDSKSFGIGDGINVKHLSHTPPKTCNCCNQLLADQESSEN